MPRRATSNGPDRPASARAKAPASRRPRRPVTDAERAQVRDLHAQGLSRAEIGRRLDRTGSQIGRIADRLGLTWDRQATAAATAAKQVDNRSRRVAIVDRLYRRTETVLDRLEAEGYEYRVIGAEGSYVVKDKHPPAQDERNLSSAMTGYLANAAKLEQIDQGDGAAEARSMLGDLARKLDVAAGLLPPAG